MSQLKQKFDEALASLLAPGAPFELIDSPQTGTGCKQYKNAPQNMVELLAPAKAHGDREFLLYEGERWSFAKILQQAASVGYQLLHKHGIQKGDRVAIAMRNYPEWMAVYMGITCVGAVAVPLNAWGMEDDLVHGLKDSDSKLLFCDQRRYDMLKNRCAQMDITPVVVRAKADIHNDAYTYEALIADVPDVNMPEVAISGDDEAMIMYTSGTTGIPKGALSTHRAICQAVYSIECVSTTMAINNQAKLATIAAKGFQPCGLMAVPLFHVGGCHNTFLMNMRSGLRIIMMYKWDADKALDFVEQENVTFLGGTPPQILKFFDSPRIATSNISSLAGIGVGGAATPPRVLSLLQKHIPHHILSTGWAMTETNSIGVYVSGEAFQVPSGSSGLPHPIVELSIRDDQGVKLPQGSKGVIWVRSVAQIKKYWNRPEANTSEFHDGWFNSGDIGHLDGEGFLHLSDRAKDVIIRGGENIYPVEIENRLLEHPDIEESAVFGLPHELMGEEVAVLVVGKQGANLNEAIISNYAKEHLSAYKVPTRIYFSAEPLPRNATNKITKNVIRKQFE